MILVHVKKFRVFKKDTFKTHIEIEDHVVSKQYSFIIWELVINQIENLFSNYNDKRLIIKSL